MPTLAPLLALFAPLIVLSGSVLAQGMVPTLPSLEPADQRPLTHGNITPNFPEIDFPLGAWIGVSKGRNPARPNDLVSYNFYCITPEGYCALTAPYPVASGLECYCDASQAPGLTQ